MEREQTPLQNTEAQLLPVTLRLTGRAALGRRAAEEQSLTDYLLEVGRVWYQDRDRPGPAGRR